MKNKKKSAINDALLIKALTEKANQQWDEVCYAWQRTLEQVRQLGKTLINLKEYIPYGEWQEWIESNFDASYDTAKNYMWVAHNWNDPRMVEARKNGMTFDSINSMHKLLRSKPPSCYDDKDEPPKSDEEIEEELLLEMSRDLDNDVKEKFDDVISEVSVFETSIIFDNWNECWEAFRQVYRKKVCDEFGYNPYEEKNKERAERDTLKKTKELLQTDDEDDEDFFEDDEEEEEKPKPTTEHQTYKAALSIRGDCLTCPLSLQIDSYWFCEPDCPHCYLRKLNRTWGMDLRPADPEAIARKLRNGLNNPNPRSGIAHALHHKKTIRIGSKTDPYQPAETEHRITRQILQTLIELRWSFVIQTMFLDNLAADEDLLTRAHELELLTLCPVISPGAEYDWEVLEREKTTPIPERLKILERWVRKGWNIGVNGEPFIPGLHTTKQFRDILKRLKSIGLKSYNTYNLHLNDFVFKNLMEMGLDVLKIEKLNRDKYWKPKLRQLCTIAKKEGMILGCPDFVNTGPEWKERTNTCCGVNVPRPSRFNTHYWKRLLQRGKSPELILKKTWEGVGDKKKGRKIIKGKPCNDYTMADAGMI